MTREEFNAFCASLPATSHVVQWGGADVWKVGDAPGVGARAKVFGICGWEDDAAIPRFTFKVSEIAFEALKDQPGLRPAPYLASRGLKWIQHYEPPGLSDDDLRDHLRASHEMAAKNLPKKVQKALGLAR